MDNTSQAGRVDAGGDGVAVTTAPERSPAAGSSHGLRARFQRFKDSRLASVLLLGVAVFAAVMALRLGGQLETLELAAYDWFIRLRPVAADGEHRVTLVTITEQDIQDQGRYPLPHGLIGDALAAIAEYGPRAIGVDLYLDVPIEPGRERLEAALAANQNIVVVTKFSAGDETGVGPPALLEGTAQVGFNDLIVDPGGTVRRGLLFLDDGESVLPSFALQLSLLFLAADDLGPTGDPDDPQHIRFGDVTFAPLEGNEGGYVRADAGGYQFLLDYRDPPDAFPQIALGDLMAGRADPALLRGKIVLFGVTAESVKDLFYTPYSRDVARAGQTSGVQIHAHIASQLLRATLEGSPAVKSLHDGVEAVWILAWCLLGALLGLMTAHPLRLTLASAGSVLALGFSTYGLFLTAWWLPLVPPLLGWGLALAIATAFVSSRDKREQASLMSLFSRHISPQLAGAIWDQRDRFLSGDRPKPQKLTATVFFSDVASFTTISERLDPAELMDWLNEYMAAMTPLVNGHGGVILRFIGDAIMAVFGVPVPRTSEAEIRSDAVNAVTCALEMQARLVEHNRSLEARGMPLVGMRIGIFTGPMVAGTIGDAQRLEYNVHGDTVNTAARLESFDKANFAPEYLTTPCRILVGEVTAAHLGDGFELERVGEELLKGKAQPVGIFRVHRRRVD